MEQRLRAVLSPSWLAPRQMERHDPRQPPRLIRLRQRLLTWPVMVAIMVSLVGRRVPSVAEGQKILTRDGLLGVAPLQVSPQAISNRFDGLPAAVMGQLCAEVCTRLQAQAPPAVPPPSWAPVRESVPVLALVDGSSLEALRHKTDVLRPREGLVLAGKVLVLGEAFSHRPRWQHDPAEALAHDTRVAAAILAARPGGGRLICDLGVFRLLWVDDLTDQPKGFVTRRRETTASRSGQVRSESPSDRDEMIQRGQYRSNPCRHPLRLVAVRWQGVW